jgi:16S rRNA (cytosine1402-N4)-methyltransferase
MTLPLGPDGTPLRKRRARYKGKNPRRFDEKYKELNPEKYSEDVDKIIKSGKTPAGMHRSILVEEVLEALAPKPGQTGLDATLGFGGHAVELLRRIIPGGRLFAIDVDPIELKRTTERLRALGFTEKELITRQINFAGIHKMLADADGGFDFILADLGVSSMQLDNPARGFTFKWEGPLDLRLNPQRGQPASALIKTISEKALEKILFANSDESHAKTIAGAIHKNRDKINTTKALADTVKEALATVAHVRSKDEITTSIRRTFQALRIEVNDEFSALDQFLRNLPLCLKPNGRVAILTFHSGEYNRVVKFFQEGLGSGVYSDISREPIRPTPRECFDNPRSKSAILRWAIKSGA